jgi:hypothetical protein
MVIKWQGEIKRQEEKIVFENSKNTIKGKGSLVLSLVSFGISVIFLSRNITGSVVLNFSSGGASWISVVFFVIAIIGGFLYIQKNKK